ncbi:MAG: hypothetical protein R3Y64_04715 [Peptostreptococcaceae bacterium]
MSLKDKFAENFAKAQTMSGSEKRANEIMSKLLLKKAIIPLIIMFVMIFVGMALNLPWWATLLINLVIAGLTYLYIKKSGENLQNFKPYMGNLISVDKKDKNKYTILLKQGKLPVRLEIEHGGEDFEKIKKNQMVQVQYNEEAKIAILVK